MTNRTFDVDDWAQKFAKKCYEQINFAFTNKNNPNGQKGFTCVYQSTLARKGRRHYDVDASIAQGSLTLSGIVQPKDAVSEKFFEHFFITLAKKLLTEYDCLFQRIIISGQRNANVSVNTVLIFFHVIWNQRTELCAMRMEYDVEQALFQNTHTLKMELGNMVYYPNIDTAVSVLCDRRYTSNVSHSHNVIHDTPAAHDEATKDFLVVTYFCQEDIEKLLAFCMSQKERLRKEGCHEQETTIPLMSEDMLRCIVCNQRCRPRVKVLLSGITSSQSTVELLMQENLRLVADPNTDIDKVDALHKYVAPL